MSQHQRPVDARAEQLLAEDERVTAARLDRLFAALFLAQWLLAIAYVSTRPDHVDDLFTAIVIGAAIATVPTTLVVWKPGTAATRHAIAVAQMLYGTLMVALTDGKLGTPYHVFASLAFLALYRDWRVMLTAASVVVFDTVGVGVLSAEIAPLDWLTHVGWVALVDACLVVSCRRGHEDLVTLARRSARLEELADGERSSANSSQVQRVLRNGAPANDREELATTVLHVVRPSVAVVPAEDGKVALEVEAVVTQALGFAPTLRPSAVMAAVNAANERSLYSDLAEEDGMQELLDGFVVRLRENVTALETAFAEHDAAELARLSHRLRGAAGSFGFPAIGEAARELEDGVRANEDVAEKLRRVAALCRRARSRRLVAQAA